VTDDTDDEATLPAMLLDRYRVEGMLGEGGLGTVVKAYDTRLKRLVAIKTLRRTSYASDPDQFRALEERFAREAEAGSRMGSHPNLVGVHDLMLDAERTQYLVLEYVAGGTLGERIARGALPLADTLRLTTEIARGLHAAHESGLVHRDVKPANIFLTASEQAKVGDFGIAQIDDISGRTRTTSGHPGTPLYMSPEQERMTAYLRPASDQYSLGLVIFEMLTGQIYKRIGARQAALLLAKQSAPVRELITRMLADDPDDRYPSMEDVVRTAQSIERQRASAVTTTWARGTPTSYDDEDLVLTRHDTPRIHLQPMPSAAAHVAPPPAILIAPRFSRRVVLIGAGGLVVVAGTAGITIGAGRHGGAMVATGTPPVTTPVAAAAATQVPATPTIAPTATNAPPTATTAPAAPVIITAAPVIITAAPIIITATPSPTAIPTSTPLPTATSIPLPTAIPPTPIPLPTAIPLPPTTATRFPPTAPSAPLSQTHLVTWTDPQGRFQIGYPNGWQPTKNPSPSVVEFLGSGIGLEVLAFLNATSTPAQQIDNIRANRPTNRKFVDGPTKSTTVGGEGGAFMQYQSLGLGNTSDVHEGALWVVKHAGTLYQFNGYTYRPSTDDDINTINAIIGSVVFLH